MIEVEANIPIPVGDNRGIRKYPWRLMNIGDSFLVLADEGVSKTQLMNRLSSTKQSVCKKSTLKYVMRSVDGGVRVWRTA